MKQEPLWPCIPWLHLLWLYLLWLYLLWLYLQELIDCFSMREAAAAQLALLRDQPEV